MTREKINALLKALGSKPTGYRAGWVEGHCALAHWNHANGHDAHPSFGIKVGKDKKSICKCLSCGFGGDLYDLLFTIKQLGRKNPDPRMDLSVAGVLIANEFEDMEFSQDEIPEYGTPINNTNEVVFPDVWLSSFRKFDQYPEAIDYLDSRSVSSMVARMLDLRFDPMDRRVCFPYRNFKGQVMGVQGRAIDADAEKRYHQYGYQNHRNSHVWMGEHTIDLDRPVVLVEGPFDHASVFRVYQNVLASFTTGLSVEKIKRIAGAVEYITLYDHGKGGNAARAKIKEYLGKYPIIDLIPSDAYGDAGAMPLPIIEQCLSGLVTFNYID